MRHAKQKRNKTAEQKRQPAHITHCSKCKTKHTLLVFVRFCRFWLWFICYWRCSAHHRRWGRWVRWWRWQKTSTSSPHGWTSSGSCCFHHHAGCRLFPILHVNANETCHVFRVLRWWWRCYIRLDELQQKMVKKTSKTCRMLDRQIQQHFVHG